MPAAGATQALRLCQVPLGAIALPNVVQDGFLTLHGTKKLWIVQM